MCVLLYFLHKQKLDSALPFWNTHEQILLWTIHWPVIREKRTIPPLNQMEIRRTNIE